MPKTKQEKRETALANWYKRLIKLEAAGKDTTGVVSQIRRLEDILSGSSKKTKFIPWDQRENSYSVSDYLSDIATFE